MLSIFLHLPSFPVALIEQALAFQMSRFVFREKNEDSRHRRGFVCFLRRAIIYPSNNSGEQANFVHFFFFFFERVFFTQAVSQSVSQSVTHSLTQSVLATVPEWYSSPGCSTLFPPPATTMYVSRVLKVLVQENSKRTAVLIRSPLT